ncbi:MAG TPA: undecaprenyl-diphosphate phosphatase [Candidatus Methylomirabilis sp.]|nr:undecaprenyl-diphosphate phosphatase [Candidatus Methylomirabilis sp.]
MISNLHAIILGAVQGLTEFLPISSTGHLVLIPYFFGWPYQGFSFDVALHAGTAVALLLYFAKDWLIIIRNGFTKKSVLPSDVSWPYPRNFFWQIVVASIPAALIGLPLDKYAENFRSPLLIAFNLAVFGWLLWLADKKAKTNLTPATLTYGRAFIVGLFQSIALIPGVSRSGITLTGSRLIGLGREEAARFSFLLATPAIVGAFLLELPKIIHDNFNLSFWLGVITAAVFGLLAIKFLLGYLKKNNFALFFGYRLVLAAVIIIFYFWQAGMK